MADTKRVSRAGRPSLPRGKDALDRAVALADEIDAAGGLESLAQDDPRRLRFARAVMRVAGLETLPMSNRKVWTSIEHVTRYEKAALAVFGEVLRRRRLAAAVEQVQAALAEDGGQAA
ncbi:hypothetical protein CcI49_03005 [Frankia sp. CcI49]|uniref:hypothetical protein n=1 Tax=Frankia sp. CcI49 TaxID=1745382 RepID=UPI000977BBD1|nr:hypothetical protein [Frankia sp. CcI49]ONH62364.1 hypothetical protein CcI49_03005 [Frankia sp. CcI49]